MMAAWLFSASLCSIYWLFCKLNFGSFLFCNIHALCSMCLIFSPFISLNVLVGRHDATGPRYPWETTLTQQFGSLLLCFFGCLSLCSNAEGGFFLDAHFQKQWASQNKNSKTGHTQPCGRGIWERLGQPRNTRNHQDLPETTRNH